MDKYTIRQLFMYLSNNQYVYCRKCIFYTFKGGDLTTVQIVPKVIPKIRYNLVFNSSHNTN